MTGIENAVGYARRKIGERKDRAVLYLANRPYMLPILITGASLALAATAGAYEDSGLTSLSAFHGNGTVESSSSLTDYSNFPLNTEHSSKAFNMKGNFTHTIQLNLSLPWKD